MERACEIRGKYFKDVEYRVDYMDDAMETVLRRNDPTREYEKRRELEAKFSKMNHISPEEREQRIELILELDREEHYKKYGTY